MKARVDYVTGYQFKSTMRDFTQLQDAAAPVGRDQGPSPKELLLSAVIGCTGMDVVGLLKKSRTEFTEFGVSANAELRQAHPRIFTQVDLIYQFKGTSLEQPDVQQKIVDAIELSLTKYCGVSAIVSKACPLYYTLMINDEIVSRGQAKFE